MQHCRIKDYDDDCINKYWQLPIHKAGFLIIQRCDFSSMTKTTQISKSSNISNNVILTSLIAMALLFVGLLSAVSADHTLPFDGTTGHCAIDKNTSIPIEPAVPGVDYSFCDFRGFPNLSGVNLVGKDLRNADFTSTHMPSTNFLNSDLRGAIFEDANVRHSDFGNIDLTNADFTGAFVFDLDMRGTNLTNTDFTDADIILVDFRDCKGIPIGVPKQGTLPICDAPTNPFPEDNLVFDETFESISGWNQIGSGQVIHVSGDDVARKTGNNDPNGAIKRLDSTVNDFEMMVHAKKINTDGGIAMRYSIVQDSNGNGYGFYITHAQMVIEKRDNSFIPTQLDMIPISGWKLGETNTIYFAKVGNELQLKFYKDQTLQRQDLDSIDPSATRIVSDNTFSGGFKFATINGGSEYDTDNYKVWELPESTTSNVYVNTHAEFTDGKPSKEFSVSCNDDDLATGGGFSTSSNGHTVKRNQPSLDENDNTPNAWLVSLTNLDAISENYVEVYVVCLDIVP